MRKDGAVAVTPQALHKQRLKAHGLCVRCSRPNDRLPYTRCTPCAERENAQHRQRREYLIARGKCHVCQKPSDGYTRCWGCRVRHTNGDKRRKGIPPILQPVVNWSWQIQ